MTRAAVLVTGASRGIGLGIAESLAAQGVCLTVAARKAETLESVAARLRDLGAPEVIAVAGDMADPGHVEKLLSAHVASFDAMGALILNAGVGSAGAIAEYPLRRFDKTVAVNLRAPLQLMQSALPALRRGAVVDPERGAKIIALASITGVRRTGPGGLRGHQGRADLADPHAQCRRVGQRNRRYDNLPWIRRYRYE